MGIVLSRMTDTKVITIKEIYKGSPADEAGLKVEDQIVAISNRAATDFDDIQEVGDWFQDFKRTSENLVIYRQSYGQDEVLNVTVQKVRFVCMYQEKEELKPNNKRFLTFVGQTGDSWACGCSLTQENPDA
jgi:carboxyl-terminal processing protease